MTALDYAVMAAYFGAVLAIGAYVARRQSDASDYFLGARTIPWWALMLSIVATETSALTVISVPGIAARGNLTFLQLPMGYLIGRIAIAAWLLPGYFKGEQETAYARLETRFGRPTRQVASGIFLVVRSLGDAVRVYATAIPLAIITNWDLLTSVVVLTLVTVLYTWAGGIKAVVWVDVLQLAVYLLGGIATIFVAANMAGGLSEALASAAAQGKLVTFDWHVSFSRPYTFLGGLIGGGLLSAASHGTDHLLVQRILAAKNLSDARRALVGSGVVVLVQFLIFLLVGAMLWTAGAAQGITNGDEIYPRFVVSGLPHGIAGLVVAGLLAAAMSTISSSLNSLASATTHDFYASLTGRRDPRHLLWVGRWTTIFWAVVTSGAALAFRSTGQPVVVLALSIASITYGGLLGTYILSGIDRVRQYDVIAGISVATPIMAVVVLQKPGPFATLAWPWYVPLGLAITLVVALTSSAFGQPRNATSQPGSG